MVSADEPRRTHAQLVRRLALTLTIILAVGCASKSNTADNADAISASFPGVDVAAHNRRAEAGLYIFPHYKYVAEPRFCFTSEDCNRALDTYRELGANTLYELIVDHRGEVKRCHLIKTSIRREYEEDVEARGSHFKFNEDRTTKLYRAFYYPVDFDYKVEFDWLDSG